MSIRPNVNERDTDLKEVYKCRDRDIATSVKPVVGMQGVIFSSILELQSQNGLSRRGLANFNDHGSAVVNWRQVMSTAGAYR